ncbi:MAG: XrtB/PEP-CTERM-associated polysaccharide biosynthesis outer membrane protein EpsL [Rugosibacter sp.]
MPAAGVGRGGRGVLIAGLLASLCAGSAAYAAPPNSPDTLQWILSETLAYDDNLFRLPTDVDPATSNGNSDRGSLIRTDTAGFAWDKPYSLQHFHVDASVEQHHYSNHDFLDFTGVNGLLAWDWSLTPHLTGVISADRKQVLNSFADYRNQGTRNVRTNQSRVAAADYEALGSWHLIAAAIDYSSVSDDTSQPIEDAVRSHGAQAGVKYVFSSTSYFSYVERSENGDYPGHEVQPATLIDSEFHQRAHELQAVWAFSDNTVLSGRLTNSERRHPNFSQRNFSGSAGRLDLNWKPTGKTSIVASAGRDFATFQTAYSNYIATDAVSIAPTWQMTAKTALKAKLVHSSRDFLGEPFGPVARRRDNINSAQLELDWDAMRSINVAAQVQHDRRNSSYPGFDYADTIVMLNLRLAF